MEANGNGNGGEAPSLLKGTEKAHTWAKRTAFWGLLVIFVWCVVFAGWLGLSRDIPFESEANFALFAAFIVVAGAIERLMEPLLVFLPPNEKKIAANATDEKKKATEAENEVTKADRTLLAYIIALAVGVAVSSLFGLYFLEAIGVDVGEVQGKGKEATWAFFSGSDEWLRGLDVFITALIITGGTKPLHDMITSIEKKKEAAVKEAAKAV